MSHRLGTHRASGAAYDTDRSQQADYCDQAVVGADGCACVCVPKSGSPKRVLMSQCFSYLSMNIVLANQHAMHNLDIKEQL